MGLEGGVAAYLESVLEAERRAFEPADFVVFSSSGHSEWPCWSVVDGVDEFRVAHDLPHRGARVPQKYMSKPTEREGGSTYTWLGG